MRKSPVRSRLLLAALTLSAILGAASAGVPGFGIPQAFANPEPPCGNAECRGWNRCYYHAGVTCSFTSDSCTTSRC